MYGLLHFFYQSMKKKSDIIGLLSKLFDGSRGFFRTFHDMAPYHANRIGTSLELYSLYDF